MRDEWTARESLWMIGKLYAGGRNHVQNKLSWKHSQEGIRVVDFLDYAVEQSSGLRANLPMKVYARHNEQGLKDSLTSFTPRFYRTKPSLSALLRSSSAIVRTCPKPARSTYSSASRLVSESWIKSKHRESQHHEQPHRNN